eukprot:TRINITY_DN38867_c0_g1_i3.p1 TRINITY_DN38867_c0_g1~~TRINITY_DN38867_c0_g1_i3.p1  ORF type:complete len:102 (+),score=9.71 TRINITY_DN38867_c0_g1_i3:217-522(+)
MIVTTSKRMRERCRGPLISNNPYRTVANKAERRMAMSQSPNHLCICSAVIYYNCHFACVSDFLLYIKICLLYTSDAADEEDSVDLGGRRIIKKKKKKNEVD